MMREWAPLWAVPVIPLGRAEHGAPLEQRVSRVYPGHLERFVLKQLRRTSSVALVPRVRTQREEELPIPALTLNRWNAPRSGLYYAPTSRGFDHYRLESGRLREVWAATEPAPGARELLQPRRPERFTAHAITRYERVGMNRIHLITGMILLFAVAVRIAADQIQPPPERPVPRPPIAPVIHPHPVSLESTVNTLVMLAREIPGFRLTELDATAQRTVVRFVTTVPPGPALDHVDRMRDRIVPEYAAAPAWDLAARRDGELTRVTLEVGNE